MKTRYSEEKTLYLREIKEKPRMLFQKIKNFLTK